VEASNGAFGVALGNTLKLDPNQSWLVLIASFASVVLTFLAGAEVDLDDFGERLAASLLIGVASFAGPFIVATLVALGLLGWTTKAVLIAATALSTTSLAVVYAVLVETGLNTVRIGKLIMSACFVTDMCTVIALSAIFIKPTVWSSGLLRRFGRGDRVAAKDRTVVLRTLWRPSDRARDQARVRGPVRVDGAR
jgi:Kef-type K+ transport system membrane component KefB